MMRSQDGDAARNHPWDEGPAPRISVVVPTHERAGWLLELVAALERQDLPSAEFEVTFVDDASTDGTWSVLTEALATSRLRMQVLRHDVNRGPAAARNLGVAASRGTFLAFTDDDCLPTPGWLSALLPALEGGKAIVQGRVTPPADEWAAAGPWDHTIWVRGPSPFFETCNVAYQRDRFEDAGGFDDEDPLLTPEAGRGFGEDAELAWRVLQGGGAAGYVDAALVHHRCVPWTYRRWLRGQRHTVGFPGLVRRSRPFEKWLRAGLFLSRRTAMFDFGLAGGIAGAVTGTPALAVLVLPWLVQRGRDAHRAARGRSLHALPLLGQLAIGDLVTLVSLAEGSLRHRRLVL